MITSMEALQQVPPQKPFVPKYPIPVLNDYNKEVYPLHYWGSLEKFPLDGDTVTPWIDMAEFRKQLTKAGIDPDTAANKLILNDLEHGANIGASGRGKSSHILVKSSHIKDKYSHI